jgi:colicin import membrane protein
MNALVSIDVATLTPATVFAPGGVEAIISKIEAEVSAEVFSLDTAEGRERIKSVAYKVARSKTALDDMGKELVADIKKQSGAIDAERRVIRERLDALKDRVRGPLTAWEDAEAARVDGHERELVWLVESDRFATTPTAAMIRAQADDVSSLSHRDWQEFKERGDAAVIDAHAKLSALLLAAEQAERDAAELAELRKLKAEREEADRIEAQAKAQAERAAQDAEAFAASERIRAEQQAKRDQERAEQAQRDQEAAAARAIEQERQRVAAEKAREETAERKRQENGRHRAKVHKAAMDALVAAGLSGPEANDLIGMIADGRIPHVRIEY